MPLTEYTVPSVEKTYYLTIAIQFLPDEKLFPFHYSYGYFFHTCEDKKDEERFVDDDNYVVGRFTKENLGAGMNDFVKSFLIEHVKEVNKNKERRREREKMISEFRNGDVEIEYDCAYYSKFYIKEVYDSDSRYYDTHYVGEGVSISEYSVEIEDSRIILECRGPQIFPGLGVRKEIVIE